MNTTKSYTDLELRKELAACLGWYKIKQDIRGDLTGRFPGVRSFFPLQIPDWTGNISHAHGIEDSLNKRGLDARYARNLLIVGGVDEFDEGKKLAFFVEATARQRSEAALMTFREHSEYNPVTQSS